jgi:nucleoside-diphosphate-sugar epimerase
MNNSVLPSSNKSYFVTGASGYLGSQLVKNLCANGSKVYCLIRRTSNLTRIDPILSQINLVCSEGLNYEDYFVDKSVNCVIHCATDYGRKATSPLSVIESNLILPLKLLHAASSAGVKEFVNTDTVLDKRVNAYSLSKNQFTQWLKTYSNQISGINVALHHFYGPGDDSTKFATQIIAALLRNHERIDLTPGEQKRDFIFIDDVVQAMIKIIDNSERLGIGYHDYQLGTGSSISIREFVESVKRITGNSKTQLNYGALPYRVDEIMDIDTSLNKIPGIDWRPLYSLEEGLKRTIQEMEEDYS